ncbi:MAG TPA: cytochrome c biogenesis heme-transporting ATPase CcmA [Ramlibacter sp.]
MLSASNLSCSRGGRPLFAGVDLRLEAGQWAHVRGANGAGKTSLLRILTGLSGPDAGEVRWNGEPIASNRAAWHTGLLYLGHQPAIKDDLTPLENLRAANEVEGLPLGDEDALRALRRFGLKGREDLPVRFLSAGQRRRVLLARTMTRPAQAWILDEPLTALDAHAVNDFSSLIAEHLARGGIAVITSHQTLPLAGGQEVEL